MRLSRIISLLIAFTLPLSSLLAQDGEGGGSGKIKPSRFLIQANGCIPHPTGNMAFRRSFVGIYDITTSFNVHLFSGFSVGLAGKVNEFKTPDNKIAGLNTYGQLFGGGLRLSYVHYLSETKMLYGGINAGETYLHYFGLSCLSPSMPEQTAYTFSYVEPDAGIAFFVEGNFAIGFHISYDIYNHAFDPYAICLNQHKAYLDSDLGGNMQHLNFGFGLSYAFPKRK